MELYDNVENDSQTNDDMPKIQKKPIIKLNSPLPDDEDFGL